MWLLNTVMIFEKLQVCHKKNKLTEISLGWSLLSKYSKEDNRTLFTPKNKHVRVIIRETVHEAKVFTCNKKFVSKSINDVLKFSVKFYAVNIELSEIFAKQYKHIKIIKNYYEKNYQSKLSVYRRINVSKFKENIENKIAVLPILPISKGLSMISHFDLLA